MKYDYERIALWSIVIILVIVVFFQQKRSGFSVQAGAETSSISILDMMEYKYIPETKRTAYKNMLMSNATTLTTTTTGDQYRMKIDQMMMAALNMTVPTSGLQFCTGTIIVGDCVNSNTCPSGLTTQPIGSLIYCVCPRGQKLLPQTGPDKPFKCINTTCPPGMPRMITESATGQQMCVPSCPTTTQPPGYTCV
jgi:hypothetical protein